MKKHIKIKSNDYWFKIVEFLQQNWALIEKNSESIECTVYFINDASGVFDRLQFPSEEDAINSLTNNNFLRYSDDAEAQKAMASPQPPFFETEHPRGPIYSSGEFWMQLSGNARD